MPDLRECAHPEHDHTFRPRSSHHKYKSSTCRKDAHRINQRRKLEAKLNDAAQGAIEQFEREARRIFDEVVGDRL